MRLNILLLSLLSIRAFAQVQFGVEVGVPLTNALSVTQSQPLPNIDAYSAQSKLLLIGPTVGFNLPGGFRIEADALYQRIDYDHTYRPLVHSYINYVEYFSNSTANRWQFPLLLQYRLKIPLVHAFVEAGPSFSLIANGENNFVGYNALFTPGQFSTLKTRSGSLTELHRSVVTGVVAGLGVDLRPAFFHIRPEIRYTRWSTAQFSAVSQYGPGDLNQPDIPFPSGTVPSLSSKRDQLDFVLGVTF